MNGGMEEWDVRSGMQGVECGGQNVEGWDVRGGMWRGGCEGWDVRGEM